MSVAWGWSAVWLRGTKAEGLAALLGALGTMGLLMPLGGGVACLLSCSIAELVLGIQHGS